MQPEKLVTMLLNSISLRSLYRIGCLMLISAGLAAADTLPDGPGVLLEDRDSRIYVAILGAEGVVARSTADDANAWEVFGKGRVEGLQIAPDGDVWLALNDEVLRYPRQGGTPVSRTPSFLLKGSPGPLLATRWGDVWCAGCGAVRRGDAMFEPAPSAPSRWEITPVCDDPFGNVWAVAEDGPRRDIAVLTNQRPHGWQLLNLPANQLAGSWQGAVTDAAGFVWVALDASVLRVDPRSSGPHRSFANPVNARITAIARGGGQLVVGFADGSLRELTVDAAGPPAWRLIQAGEDSPVQALLHARSGSLWVLRAGRVQQLADLESPWHEHWDEQPPMPAGNHDHIFARIGDRLYTAGGKTFFGWPASEWVNLDHVWSYHIPSGTWRVEPPMLEPGKAYSGIAALDDELWLLGGHFRAGRGTRATATVEIFDPRTRRYRLGPPLPRKAGQVVALAVNGRLYAVGGADDEGPTAEVLSIGIGETSWRVDAPAPGPVSQASGCVLNGKIYIAAGPASQCPGLFAYDPERDRWSQIEHPSRPPSAPLCTAFDGSVWVMGGRGADSGQTAAFAYAPDTGQWRRVPDLPLPVSWGAAAAVNGRLLIAGGAYRDERVGNYFNSDRVFLLRGVK